MNKYSKSGPNGKEDMMRLLIVQVAIAIFSVGIVSMSFASENAESFQSQEITVYKSPQCGCCTKWVEHLEKSP